MIMGLSFSTTTVALVYLIEGTTIVPLNFILALAIIFNPSLRTKKELVFVAALAVADTMYGIGVFDLGRDTLMNQVLSNDSLIPATPIHCFFRINELFISYPSQVSLLIMIAISGERLIAVVWFQKYAHIRYRSYVYVLLFAFLFPVITMSVAGVQSYMATQTGKMVTRQCVKYSPIFTLFMPFFKICLGIIGVTLYLFVFIAYLIKVSPLSNATANRDIHAARRRRLTQTMAIITGCTLIFYCLPHSTVLILNNVFGNFTFNGLVWLCLPIQYIVHVLVFYWRQKEIRQSIKALLCFKIEDAQTSGVALSKVSEQPRKNTNVSSVNVVHLK